MKPTPRFRRPSLALGLILLLACATNPVTGQREIVLMSPEQERAAGAEAAREVASQIGLVEDPELAGYVSRVGQRLATHSPRQDITYTFAVVDMPEPNAFALPGGYIYVSRGLLAIANSEQELAGVIGHEIGHVAAMHHSQRQTRAAGVGLLSIGGLILGSILGVDPGALQGPLQVLGGGLIAAYSRDQERQADVVGQQMAADAGYHPAGLADFLYTLQRDTELRAPGRRPGFFDTHPSTPERVAAARQRAPTLAISEVPGIAPDRRAFLSLLDGLLLGENPAQGVFDGQTFLHPDLEFAVEFPRDWQTVNTPTVVGGVSPGQEAQVVLELQGRGDDPGQAAQAYLQELANRTRVQSSPIETGRLASGLPAARARAAIQTQSRMAGADFTWVAHGGLIFRTTGATASTLFSRHADAFERVGQSFRPLGPGELAGIREQRLRLGRARAGESLASFARRHDNAWTLPELAVANGLTTDAVLQSGALIKIAAREPYRRAP